MKRTLLTTLLCLIAAMAAIAQPRKSFAKDCGRICKDFNLGGMYWEYSCDDPQGTLRAIVRDALLK